MIKAFFFDIFEVLTEGDFDSSYSDFAGRLSLSSEVVENFYKENLSGLLTGDVTTADEMKHYGVEGSVSEEAFLLQWSEVINERVQIKEGMLPLLESLRKNYSMTTVTNLTPSRKEADIKMGLYDYFDHLVLSCDEGCKKPDPKIFEIALERTGFSPEEVVFVDDQTRNTDVAEELGMKTIQFLSYEQFAKDLESLDIKF